MTNDRIVTGVKTLSGNDPWAQGQSFMTVEQMQAEIKRLRVLVINAYAEGGNHATLSLAQVSPNPTIIDYWMTSKTRAALQPKEGEG